MTYIILLYQYYTRSKRRRSSLDTIRRHLLHVDYPLDLQCHPFQFVCNPFEVEGERELIGEVVIVMVGGVVVEMVSEIMVKMVMEVVVHLSLHCHHYHPLLYLHLILRYTSILTHHPILSYALILTHHSMLLYPHKLAHQLRLPFHMSFHHYHPHLTLCKPHLYHLRCHQSQLPWQ